jgi:cold shock CspA family protein
MSHVAPGSAKAPITRLSDYTRQLDFLHNSNPESDVLDAELARTCTAAFGASLYEIGDQCLVNLISRSKPYTFKDAAIRFALKNGYDIAHSGGLLPVRDWQSFTLMVMAAAENSLLPANDIIGRSLRSEAARFQQLNDADGNMEGEVLWFSAEKGFGYIRPVTDDGERPRDVWFGMSEITRSGLEIPQAGQWLSFRIGQDRKNRPQATDLKRIRLYRRDVVERYFGNAWDDVLTTAILFA